MGTETAVVPNTDSATGLAISEIPVRAHATINGESVDLGLASLNIVLIENDYTKCDVFLRYGYCMTAGTATQIAIDPVKISYN